MTGTNNETNSSTETYINADINTMSNISTLLTSGFETNTEVNSETDTEIYSDTKIHHLIIQYLPDTQIIDTANSNSNTHLKENTTIFNENKIITINKLTPQQIKLEAKINLLLKEINDLKNKVCLLRGDFQQHSTNNNTNKKNILIINDHEELRNRFGGFKEN
ncbi:hypothetical protein CDIK_1491 [Cucumispora dikerogammari]|nr:hypothetical protein CDIK_1491 [Cucumispora dikerogammari]